MSNRRLSTVAVAVVAAVAALIATVLGTGAPASARAAAVDLHHVSFLNRTIPGATCESKTPITLHNGRGKGGHGLVVELYGSRHYGDLNHDGHADAVKNVLCSTGGGTAASDVKYSLIAFSGSGGRVHLLRGLIVTKHVWPGVHAALLSAPRIVGETAYVTEDLYAPTDADCCPGQRADAAWVYLHGTFVARYSRLRVTPGLVRPTAVGHAALGMTPATLRRYYPSLQTHVLTGGCTQYTNGGAQTSRFYALVTPSSHGRVVGILAPADAVTSAGIGTYSTLADLRTAYRGHTIRVFAGQGGEQVTVREPSSYIGASETHRFGGTYLAHLRIGSRAFAAGDELCSG